MNEYTCRDLKDLFVLVICVGFIAWSFWFGSKRK
jgi:hypothetical protein